MKRSLAICLWGLLSCATPPEPVMPDPSRDAIETFTGTVVVQTGEPGSKSEGEQWLVLVVGDERFELDNAGGLQAGERVTVRGRRMAPSPYATHRPGPRLEILEVVRP